MRAYNLILQLIITSLELSAADKILVVSMCQSGHSIPLSGLTRAMTSRGHDVDIHMTNDCCEKVTPLFKGIKLCYESPQLIPYFELPEEGSPLTIFLEFADILSTNATYLAYKEISKTLSKKNFDVEIFPLFGAQLAAKKFDIPCVSNYMGPVIGSHTDEQWIDSGDEAMVYFHSGSNIPKFVQRFLNAVVMMVYHLGASSKIFEYLHVIHRENNWNTDYLQHENSGLLGTSFMVRHAVVLSNGSPDIALYDYNFQFLDHHNINSVGFVPDANYYKQIPEDLQMFMAAGELPLVYISLGTLVDVTRASLESLFDDICSQSNFRFIWALTAKNYAFLGDLSQQRSEECSNLFYGTKLPQLSILSAEETKVFVTHAGANSIQEGIFVEKPMLVYPSSGDQPINARRLVKRGVALDLWKFSFESVETRLNEILEEPKYALVKSELKEMKERMIKLGGFQRSVDIIEMTANGSVKVKSSARSQSMNINYIYSELLRFVVIVISCSIGFYYSFKKLIY